ncbi:hypothetical protein [Streptomyces halstedii]|uniref:hypothetical protein n=1 Tax=Streptomyces halstedii TaxID=1944 RepID=UPI0036A07DD5
MAWLTKIKADAQVQYRLREQAGCGVVEADAVETLVVDNTVDAALDYRLRPEGDGHLVWVGSGMTAFGYTAGDRLDDEAKDAARRIMNGCHPASGARLLASTASVRARPDAQLTVARLLATGREGRRAGRPARGQAQAAAPARPGEGSVRQ